MFSLPLKTSENKHGIFTEHELFMALSVIFACIFFDFSPEKSFPLHRAALAVAKGLGKLIEANVKSTSSVSWAASITDSFHENSTNLKDYGVHMVRRLLESGLSVEDVAWSQVFPTATAMVPNQSQVVSGSTHILPV